MWSRMELKERAKSVLKVKYLKLLLVCVVMAILAGQGSSNARNSFNQFKNTNSNEHRYNDYDEFGDGFRGSYRDSDNFFKSFFMNDPVSKLLGFVFGGFFVIFVIVVLAFRIFVSNQIYVGGIKYIVETNNYKEVEPVPSLLWTLKTGNFTKVFVTMFLRDLFIVLWSLLLVIPGIIKSYEYYFIPFILADNPGIDRRRAFEISRAMTNGQKMDIFILNVSFVLWSILAGIIPFGGMFLMPYTLSTDAQLYLNVKQTIIDSGLVDASELEFNDKY